MPSLLVLGARRLGGAIVDRFASRGYDVAAVSLSEPTAQQVQERHPQALALVADLARADEVERVTGEVRERFGSIDVAVNAVSPLRRGIVTGGPLAELGADAVEPYTQGLIPAAAAATRALTHVTAQELRPAGVHVALLIVDAIIDSDKTAEQLTGKPEVYSARHEDVVDAVEFLVGQSPRGWTHELTITPMGDRWVP